MAIIYYKDGTTNDVPEYDIPYWETQGWSRTPPKQQGAGNYNVNVDPAGISGSSYSRQTPQSQPISTFANQSQLVTLYNKNGQTADVYDYKVGEFLAGNPGWSQTPNQIQPTTGGQEGWTDAMKASYGALKEYINVFNQQGKVVNPNLEITQEQMGKFLTQAKNELEPYYGQIFKETERDLGTGFEQIGREYQQTQEEIGRQYGQQLEQTQESFARRGLSDSSMRQQAEKEIGQTAQRQLGDIFYQTQQKSRQLGLKGERELGSQFFQNKPFGFNMQEMQVPQQMRPGIYGLSQLSPRYLGYTSAGGITGEQERQRLFDEQKRARELGLAEIGYSSGFIK